MSTTPAPRRTVPRALSPPAPTTTTTPPPVMASASSSPPTPGWGILATIPRVCAADADLPPGADLSLALAAPPGISVLTVPPRISPDRLTEPNFPSVLAADPSGLLLLHATQGAASVVPLGYDGGLSCSRHLVHGYFVCDARSATASPIPHPQENGILDAGNLGLLTRDGGRTYMLAELKPIVGSSKAVLLRFSSETGRWVSDMLDSPLDVVRPWASHGVVSQSHSHLAGGDRLWWFDVSWGLLTCCPFNQQPELKFVPLPASSKMPFHCGREDLQRHRCFAVSDGAVRFVEIAVTATPKVTVHRLKRPVQRHGHTRQPWVRMYTLCHRKDDDGGDSWSWRIEHEVPFRHIWSRKAYKATRLPTEVPKLACIDPSSADHIYFFLHGHIFGVDLCSATVLKCIEYTLENPPPKYMSSRFVVACAYPPSPATEGGGVPRC